MHIGEKIEFFRGKSNLTQKQLASMIRISEERLASYEKGEQIPSAELLKEITHRLRVSPVYFFEREEKSLLMFPMDCEAFKSWCQTTQRRFSRPFFDVQFFEYSIKSDRYFINLRNRYLIRLKDGFYFVPIQSKWYAGKQYQILDLDQTRKVLNEDLLFIEREIAKPYLFRLNQDIFSKEVYISKYDGLDPVYLSDEGETELFEIATRCNHIIGYNEQLRVVYLLETNGINRIPLAGTRAQNILNERKIYLNIHEKKLLNASEIKHLQYYVLNEAEFIQRVHLLLAKKTDSNTEQLISNSGSLSENIEMLEQKECLHEEDYDTIAHFVRLRYWALDNIKRMLYITEEFSDSIFEDEWRVGIKKDTMNKMRLLSDEKKELTILLAEDSTFMRSVYINILNRHFSCEVEEAKDGEMALTMFEEKRKSGENYDLIILDITMPKIDGFTLLRQIMKQDEQAAVVMCSSVTNKKIVFESLRNGAKHFITKPIEEKNMVDILKKVLSKRTND